MTNRQPGTIESAISRRAVAGLMRPIVSAVSVRRVIGEAFRGGWGNTGVTKRYVTANPCMFKHFQKTVGNEGISMAGQEVNTRRRFRKVHLFSAPSEDCKSS